MTLVTNGALLEEAAVERAVAARVHAVAVSVDGLRATHDRIRPAADRKGSSFDATLAALRRLRAAGVRTAAITHVNRWNLDELDGIHAALGDEGVDS